MYTAVRIVKMYAWSTATRISNPVSATDRANAGTANAIVDGWARRYAVPRKKIDRITCPAIIVARSRTASVNGRRMNVDTSSIGVNQTYMPFGTPGGNRAFLKYAAP